MTNLSCYSEKSPSFTCHVVTKICYLSVSGFTVKEMPSFRGKHESPENDVYAVCEEQDSIELLITLYMQSSLDVMCYKNSKNSDFLRY